LESRALILFAFLGVFSLEVSAQSPGLRAIGWEAQLYPAGYILGLRYDHSIGDQWTANLRLGYNFARRRDLGEHDNEEGGGMGGGLGVRYFFKPQYQGLFLGLRMDLWKMDIDWRTDGPPGPSIIGNTEITVLQPLAEGGYAFTLADGNWVVVPKISLGYEINIKSEGEDVGEGAISLIGVSIQRRIGAK
jgi:hypothetical protein